MKSSFFSRLDFNYKWRTYEFVINIFLILLTLIVGYVCQYYIATISSEGYSKLSYADAINSVSSDLDRIDGAINYINGVTEATRDLVSAINSYDEYKAVNAADSIKIADKFNKILMLSRYLDHVEPICDSIESIIPLIIRSSHIVEIPLMVDYKSVRDSIDACIIKLKQWELLNKTLNDTILNIDDFKYEAISKCHSSLKDSVWIDVFARYNKLLDRTPKTVYLDSCNSYVITKGVLSWISELDSCQTHLQSIDTIYSRFAAFEFSDIAKRKRLNNVNLIFLAGALFSLLALILLGFLFIPFPDKNYEISDLIKRRTILEDEVKKINDKIEGI